MLCKSDMGDMTCQDYDDKYGRKLMVGEEVCLSIKWGGSGYLVHGTVKAITGQGGYFINIYIPWHGEHTEYFTEEEFNVWREKGRLTRVGSWKLMSKMS